MTTVYIQKDINKICNKEREHFSNSVHNRKKSILVIVHTWSLVAGWRNHWLFHGLWLRWCNEMSASIHWFPVRRAGVWVGWRGDRWRAIWKSPGGTLLTLEKKILISVSDYPCVKVRIINNSGGLCIISHCTREGICLGISVETYPVCFTVSGCYNASCPTMNQKIKQDKTWQHWLHRLWLVGCTLPPICLCFMSCWHGTNMTMKSRRGWSPKMWHHHSVTQTATWCKQTRSGGHRVYEEEE